jgi:hypothetical protein
VDISQVVEDRDGKRGERMDGKTLKVLLSQVN